MYFAVRLLTLDAGYTPCCDADESSASGECSARASPPSGDCRSRSTIEASRPHNDTSAYEKTHGRETEREYFVCEVHEDLPDASRWPKLKAIGMTVNRTLRDGKETIDGRYYIISRKLTGKQFAEAVRGHWLIENSLHWQLDVTFGEDQCRIRKGHTGLHQLQLC